MFRIRDRNIWIVYGAILLLGIAYGIAISLIAHHLDARGFTKSEMGSLASWFALGIVSLSIPVGKAIRRWSAKATLLTCLVGYTAAVTAFPALEGFAGVAVDRFLDGAFSVGIWVSCETILLARAERGTKAFVTGLYATSIALGYVVGPLLAKGIVLVASIPRAFLVSGALAAASAILVAVCLDAALPSTEEPGADGEAAPGSPASPGLPATPGVELLVRIKSSCFATFAYGYFQASVVAFLPLYLVEAKGVEREQTILVPFFFALGMLLFSNVAGRLGDRYGHLHVMRVLGAIGTTMVLGFVVLRSFPVMAIAVFIAGATLATISPVSLALQGVVAPPQDYSRSNAIYNAFYAAGMLFGPKTSSLLFARYGGAAMLLHLAALWAAFVTFTIVFWKDDPAALRGAAPVGGVVAETGAAVRGAPGAD